MPCGARPEADALVGVCVVVVVLDPPGLKGVDERRKHQRAHNILHKVVLVEGAVASIVADGEELQEERAIGQHSS